MNNISRIKQFDYTKSLIKNHIKKHKWIYISLLITLCIGILIGVITISSIDSTFEIGDLRDKTLLDFLKGDNSWIGFFLLRFYEGLIFIIIILICSLKKWLIIGDFILIIINGYFIGVNCTIIILSLGIIGILYTLLIIAPCYIFTNILLMFFTTKCIKNFENSCMHNCNNKFNFSHKICIVLLLLFILKLIEVILISIFITKFLILG